MVRHITDRVFASMLLTLASFGASAAAPEHVQQLTDSGNCPNCFLQLLPDGHCPYCDEEPRP